MKIIKHPTYKVIECECGTVFQPEAGDTMDFMYDCLGVVMLRICCPICGKWCHVEIEKEKGTPPETCVSCGEIIPEGGQYCPNCGKGETDETSK